VDRTLSRIEQKLTTVAGIIRNAALEAESLRDQGWADELHALHQDLTGRMLPALRDEKPLRTPVT